MMYFMIGKKDTVQEMNFIETPTALFMQYYNQNIPEIFPRATLKALEKFRVTYPGLFKESDDWTIDRHRKKLMDWLTSYRETV